MERLSVTIIAANEADRIGAAIRSVLWADEVLVVDSGSTDETVRVARSLGARVIETDWPGYRDQKNRAAEWAANDWVLGLDADEVVPETLALEIQEILREPDAEGFEVARLGHWMGSAVHYGVWRPDRSVRLFNRARGRWSGGLVHERVEVSGRVGRCRSDLHHFPYRNLTEHLETLQEYASLFTAERIASGRRARWLDVAFRPALHLLKALLLKGGVLDGFRGLALAVLGAAGVLLKWGMLYRAQRGID